METKTRLSGIVDKGWGSEYIWVSNDRYCSKFLNFKENAKFSMHFHKEKEETWYVVSGKFILIYIDTKDSTRYTIELNKGDTWHNHPLMPHQLWCLEEECILEVSTPDSVEDNYRIEPGDSQDAIHTSTSKN